MAAAVPGFEPVIMGDGSWGPVPGHCVRPIPVHMRELFEEGGEGPPERPGAEGRTLRLIHRAPNIYVVEDFLSAAELEQLRSRSRARCRSFRRSTTDSAKVKDHSSTGRTSTFLYLRPFGDRLAGALQRRAAALLGTRAKHVEPLQIVRYHEGQQFVEHHDAAGLADDGRAVLLPPARVATIFVYLNDLPAEAGGATCFTQLRPFEASGGGSSEACGGFATLTDAGLAIRPRAGMAVVWSNVKVDPSVADRPYGPGAVADKRVLHCGCPLLCPAEKLGLNIWILDEPVSYSLTGLRKYVRAMWS